jgi:hypothetical protein
MRDSIKLIPGEWVGSHCLVDQVGPWMNVCINNPLSERTLHTKLVVLDLVIGAMFCFFLGGGGRSPVFSLDWWVKQVLLVCIQQMGNCGHCHIGNMYGKSENWREIWHEKHPWFDSKKHLDEEQSINKKYVFCHKVFDIGPRNHRCFQCFSYRNL